MTAADDQRSQHRGRDLPTSPYDARSAHASDGTIRAAAGPMALTRSFGGVLFALLATVGCTIQVTPKDKAEAGAGAGAEAGAVVCCRPEPGAGPEGCRCEPVAKEIIIVTSTSCSASTTVNGQVVDLTAYVVPTCP